MKKGIRLITKKLAVRSAFKNSPFASLTVNFGPRTICVFHRDFANLAPGMCAITALGNYDHTKGGHIVLWELKLIIEFPPGTTVLIPSAFVTHANIPVAEDEIQYSFTQYSAASLYRYVENGFVSNKTLFAQWKAEDRHNGREKEWLQWQRENNWRTGMERFKVWKPANRPSFTL
jgi:hypothetical protein